MGLRTCKDCGHKVSRKAATCPNCGGPVKGRGNVSPTVGCLVIAAVIAAIVWAAGRDGREPAPPAGPQEGPQQQAAQATSASRATTTRATGTEGPEPRAQVPEPPGFQQNIVQAQLLVMVVRDAGRVPPLQWESGFIGTLRGACRIAQIRSPSSALMDLVDSDDLAQRSFIVRGMDTAGQADGNRISFGNVLLKCTGTESYTTVLGATRTVYSLEAVNLEPLIEAQQYRLDQAQGDLDALEQGDVAKAIAASGRLRMYEPVADRTEKAAQVVEECRSVLAELGEPTEEQASQFRQDKQLLNEDIADAESALRCLRALQESGS
jgi:hypothetical protein